MSDPNLTTQRQIQDLKDQLERLRKADVPGTTIAFSPYENLTSPFSANGNPFIAPIANTVTPIKFAVTVFVSTTNDGTHFWTLTLNTLFGTGGATTQCTVTTAAIAANSWVTLTATTFTTAQWVNSSIDLAFISIAKTSTPGSLAVAPLLYVL